MEREDREERELRYISEKGKGKEALFSPSFGNKIDGTMFSHFRS